MASRDSVRRVCLAYSGGLDTSVILRWLIEEYGCEVVAYCADVGQEEELSGLPEKARSTGAVDCIVRDVREEFVSDFVFPAIQAGAIYEGVYLLGTALARPLIAKRAGDTDSPIRAMARRTPAMAAVAAVSGARPLARHHPRRHLQGTGQQQHKYCGRRGHLPDRRQQAGDLRGHGLPDDQTDLGQVG